jgi:hypothetical protein
MNETKYKLSNPSNDFEYYIESNGEDYWLNCTEENYKPIKYESLGQLLNNNELFIKLQVIKKVIKKG